MKQSNLNPMSQMNASNQMGSSGSQMGSSGSQMGSSGSQMGSSGSQMGSSGSQMGSSGSQMGQMGASGGQSFGDQEMMNDVLSSQKLLTGNYNNFANECASPALLSEMMNILNEEHQIQHQVFDEMQKRGWYQTEPAQQQKVDQCKQQYASQQSSLQS